ncbi:FAD:protein FMN transferase [Nocardioides sp. HM23]|uniref:FAD:protein FMN transferase n=1 Tax=Nocardioides bizhenqiangii TaxID=3095076 RepID=UPI002ACAE951|nr:FAD:protein FMN transferase [Nocardioides sp. HM23]MDZ5621724.1 FAD:protein FMN transferase [Nocardioides sp. HM23]
MSRWRVWSTYVQLCVSDDRMLLRAEVLTRRLLAAVDRTCSRFRADSDLSRLNAAPGRWVEVDPLLVEATRVAVEAARITDGLVDPCVGRALVSWGYDVDLEQLVRRPARAVPEVVEPTADWREIRWDVGALWLPPDCLLDLGATAKAWAADLVADTVAAELGCGVLISLGGDVRVVSPADLSWPVRVTETEGSPVGQTVDLGNGGMATSTLLARRWRTEDGWAHHLIDPRTSAPVTGEVRTATALGETAVGANVASTAALVLGDEAEAWLAAHGVHARLVLADGTVRRVGSWPAASSQETAA